MSAEESLRQGNLDKALEELQDKVRDDPSDGKLRIFLFQLLSVIGNWERAQKQLKVAGDLGGPEAMAMVQTYQEAIACEVVRAEIFAGKRSPLIFGEPEEWIAHLLTALKLTAEGQFAQAGQLRQKAFEEAPTTKGKIDDEPFEWIADADTRLGPILEVVVNGRYQWVPIHRLQGIKIEEPEDLRDLVWTPAYFTLCTGAEVVGFIPTRYPGSEAHADPLVRMARRTEWLEKEGDTYLGIGQRLLATDKGEHPLMEARQIDLDTGETTAGADG